MKIAIFISGQPRLIDLSLINYFKSQNIDFDIFLHYWIPKNDNLIYSKATTSEINVNKNLMYKKNINDILIKHYNPIKIKGEIQIDFEKLKLNKKLYFRDNDNLEYYDNHPDKNVNPKVPQSTAYSCKCAFELCEDHNKYDWLIKTRYDVYGPLSHDNNIRPCAPEKNREYHLTNNINTTIDFNKCDKTKVNFFNIYDHVSSDRGEPMSEIWIVSNECKQVFNYYDDLINCGACPSNESILYYYCLNNNLKINSLGISHGFNRSYNNTDYVFT